MKRMTDTDKWTNDKWFSELEPMNKLFWLYIVDRCDNVGVWEVNLKMAGNLIGYTYSMDTLLKAFDKKIHVFDDGEKWWIKTFVDFQHGNLDPDSTSKPIQSYIRMLEKHGLSKGYAKGIQAVQGKGRVRNISSSSENEDPEFELFWEVYPKKQAKVAAKKSWSKINEKPSIEFIIEKLNACITSEQWQKSGGQFIPMPSTWINQKRWNDVLTVSHVQEEMLPRGL